MFSKTHIKKILSHEDSRGFFREIFHSNKYCNIKQISHSMINRNVTKGWHIHKKQYQWNYLIKGKILVYLIDLRKNSKSYKKKIKILLDSKKNKISYFFPPGVAHGYKTLATNNHIIYGTSGKYSPSEEYKLPLNNNLFLNPFKNK
jgi:dTDP-4-dehydrorhamnose 3,5-epimerase